MRFDIKTAPMHTTWADMLAVWKEADRIPLFETAWNFDHFEPIFSDRTGPCLEGWTMLAAMAGHTSRIRLGCQVTGMPYRHPSLLANIAATTDIVTGGRLVLGLGAGWNKDECDALGFTLPPLKERFEQFFEGIEVIVSLLSKEVSDFEGKHFQLRAARCEPKPIQRPHPPIAIGGNGERKTLLAVAKWAQHWNSVLSDVDQWKQKKDVLLRHCVDVGRDPSTIDCSINLRFDASKSPNALADEAHHWAEAGVDVGVIYFNTPHTPEPLAAIADALAPLTK